MNADHSDTGILLAYLRGELDSDAIRKVESRLLGEKDLRRQLLELSIEEAALTDWARMEQTLVALENKTFENEPIPNKARPARRFPQQWLAAAAGIVLAGFAAILFGGRSEQSSNSPGVARLVASVDAEWKRDPHRENENLPAGDHELLSGSVDLDFVDGAQVSLSGPARFKLISSRHIHLETGNLVARIPDEALGFIVTSPQSEVIDLGTEFGLSVSEEGLTDVHVIDGLVEVFPRKAGTWGVKVSEGQARRFEGETAGEPAEIPLSSRASLLGDKRHRDLGVEMLRGSVRIASGLSESDLTKQQTGPHWIDLIAEKQGIVLTDPIEITLDSPGSYREFGNLDLSLPAGTRVNSYLLHFRPSSYKPVHGVIRFDQPIVGVICSHPHLVATDAVFGVTSVSYPPETAPRGMEPGPYFDQHVEKHGYPADFEPDEVILSQDRSAISIRAFATPEVGYYDQV
ncbi:MAG: FecR family protein, partial [Verrucomicrobiales bacterium]|nr:FecR family protein [Verrucomicrobiales bacterium]